VAGAAGPKKVVWASQAWGDGLGFDVLSFDEGDEGERFLEVKTTGRGSPPDDAVRPPDRVQEEARREGLRCVEPAEGGLSGPSAG
jgi:hypothetical protein